MTTALVVLLGLAAGLAAPAQAQSVIYVDQDATGANDGSSWNDAYVHLQDALDRANANASTDFQIRVATGIYQPDEDDLANDGVNDGSESSDHTDGDAGERFYISENNVVLFGGYPSGGGTRDPQTNRTILSGDLNGDDVDPDSDGIIEDADPNQDGTPENLQGQNTNTVLYLDGRGPNITNKTVIDGLYVTGGHADGARGGGLYCYGKNSNECSPILTRVVFSGNAANEGGAIFLWAQNGTSNPTITNSTFTGNAAGRGGAMHNVCDTGGTSSPTIINTVFTRNAASSRGGAIENDPNSNGTSRPTIINATFVGNTAANTGGAIFNDGGSSTLDIEITNTLLWGNRASAGGDDGDEIYNNSASATINHSIVEAGDDGIANSTAFSGGTNNLQKDPLLEYAPLAAGDDGTFATDDDGLHVTPGSPALDAGDNTALPSDVADLDGDSDMSEQIPYDLTGRSRVQNSTVDIGAYEGGRDQARTIYVDPTASGTVNGTSWADADTTLQDTSSVVSGPFSYATGNDEVRVAEGVYTPQKEDTSFTITGVQDGLEVYGGYPNGGGTRDPQGNPTILSGDVSGDDTDPDGDNIVENASDIQGTNTHHVLYLDGASSGTITRATRIDGVIVTAGQATGSGSARDGGGVYCQADQNAAECNPTLAQVVFSGNLSANDGGALFTNALNGGVSDPKIIGSQFIGNKSVSDGGAVFNEDGADPLIVNTVFDRNRADGGAGGGAIYNSGGSPTITNVTFSNNQVPNGDGGALYIAGLSNPTVTNSILWGNGGSEVGDEDPTDSDEATFSHSIVQGSGGSSSWDTSLGTDNGGNIDADPLFVDAASGNVRLNWASPAIDAGDGGLVSATQDLDGNARNQGTNVDLGAYEGGAAPSSVTTLHVDSVQTTGGTSGSTWGDAYGTLQAALAAVRNERAASGTLSFSEVQIAEGVYYPDEGPGIPAEKQDTSFVVTGNEDGLQLRGGYPSGGGSQDPDANATVLSGDIDADNGGADNNKTTDGITPTAADISGTNSYHVLVVDGGNEIGADVAPNVTTSTVIDGLHITAGQADGSSTPDNEGGGLFCDARALGNECSPALQDVVFIGNSASYRGGAIFNFGRDGTSSPSLTNASFIHNAASIHGGAIYNRANAGTSSPSITNATFTGNSAGNDGGAIYNDGSNSGTSSPSLSNTILWGNSASSNGNEVFNNSATPTFAYSIIQGSGGSDSWSGPGSDGGGNLDADPLFVDAPNGNVRILGGSPALDAGDDGAVSLTEDIAGDPRTQNGTVDIGAYEGAESPAVQLSTPTNVPDSSVDLSGTIVPYAPSADATVEVEPVGGGTVTSTTQSFSGLSFPDSASSQSVAETLSNLEPATAYEARLIGNDGTQTTGDTLTFETDDTTSPEMLMLDSPSARVYKKSSDALDVTYSYVDATPDTVTITLDDGTNTASFGIDDSGYAADGTQKTASLDLSTPDAESGGLVSGNTYDVTVTATDDSSNTSSVTGTGLVTIDDGAPISVTLASPTDSTFRQTGQTLDVIYSYEDPRPDSTTIAFADGSGNTAAFGIDDSGYAGDGSSKTVTLDLSVPKTSSGSGLTDGFTYDLTVTATDSAGNSNATTGTDRLTIDNTAPSIADITRFSPTTDSTNNTSVTFKVAFSEIVTNVSTVDFSANTTISGAQVSSVSTSGSDTTVTVGSINGDGDLQLGLGGSLDIQDRAGNDLSTAEPPLETYTIDQTPPSVQNVSLDVNASDELVLTVETGEPLDSDNADLQVSVDGPSSGADIYAFDRRDFSGSGTGPYTYTLTAAQSYDDGDGTYTARVDDAVDPAGNDGADGTQSDSYTFDGTPPTIAGGTVAEDNSYVDVSFSEGVYTNSGGTDPLTTGDLELTFNQNDGAATNVSIDAVETTSGAALSGGETTVRVQVSVSGAPASGVEAVNIQPASGSAIYDAKGNPMDNGEATGPLNLSDRLPPEVSEVAFGTLVSTGDAARIDATGEMVLRLTSDEPLALGNAALTVSVDGPSAGADWKTFSDPSFSETDNGDGTYTYALSVESSFNDGPGPYKAVVDNAVDRAGNSGPRAGSANADSVRGVTIDVQVGEATRGEPVDVDLTARGGFAPTGDTTFAARKGGGTTYRELGLSVSEPLAEGTAGTLQLSAVLPDSIVTARGVDYYAQFASGPDTLTVPAGGPGRARARPAHLPVTFDELAPDTSRASVAFREEKYRMVSVPGVPDDGIKAALEGAYGTYDATQWRVLRWSEPENGGEGAYREYPALDTLKPGQGFWLVTRRGIPPSVSGGQTVRADSAYRIPLEAGWNQIGTPFGFAVPWSAVRDSSGLSAGAVDGPFTYRDGQYEADSLLAPWEGHFVFSAEADTLVVPPVGAPDAQSRRQPLAKAFEATSSDARGKSTEKERVTLTVEAETKSGKEQARLGLWPKAKDGRDAYDQAKPPSVQEGVELAAIEEIGDRAVPHAGSAKPVETAGGGRGQSWRLRLSAPEDKKQKVKLFVKEAGMDRSMYLLDLSREKRMLRGAELTLKAGETRVLKAIVGSKGYASAKSEGIDLDGFKTKLRGAYPNPFQERATVEYVLSEAQAVTVEVYDVLGRKVRTLAKGEQETGVHRVRWDGKSRQGVPVGSGMYFVRMRAKNQTQTKKVVRVR